MSRPAIRFLNCRGHKSKRGDIWKYLPTCCCVKDCKSFGIDCENLQGNGRKKGLNLINQTKMKDFVSPEVVLCDFPINSLCHYESIAKSSSF